MKHVRTGFVIALLGTILLFCWVPRAHAAAVWDIDLTNLYGSDTPFTLTGQFTTATADPNRGVGTPVLSFTGTFDGVPVTLAGPGVPGFDYDQLFYGPSDPAAGFPVDDSFDSLGLLVVGGGHVVNVYSAFQLIVLDGASDSGRLATGDITFVGLTSAVPEPAQWLLFLCVLTAMGVRRVAR